MKMGQTKKPTLKWDQFKLRMCPFRKPRRLIWRWFLMEGKTPRKREKRMSLKENPTCR